MRQGFLGLVFVALGLSVSGGCSVLIGDVAGAQCNEDVECTDRKLGDKCVHNVCVTSSTPACTGDSCAYDGTCKLDADCKNASEPRCMRGTCVESSVAERFVCGEPQVSGLSENVHYSFQVVEFVTRKPPAGLVVLACRGSEVTCNDASARFEDKNGTGLVEFDLPFGFLGFFEVKSNVTLPALSYLTKAITSDFRDRDLQVASAATVGSLATIAGVPFDESKGIVMIEAFDCNRTPQAGVHFTESKRADSSTPFYLLNHVPSAEVKVSVFDEVNNVADGGFLNVLPSFVTFTARLGETGPVIGEFNAAVRANTVTYIDMHF